MYGHTRFSLARYSLSTDVKEIPVEESFSANCVMVAGAAIPVECRERFAAAFEGSAQGTAAVITVFQADSSLTADVRMCANVCVQAVMTAELTAKAYGCKDIADAPRMMCGFSARLWGSKDIPMAFAAEGIMQAAAYGCMDILERVIASAALGTILEAVTISSETETVQITIPPGGELRIDSETFTILLNDENVLYAQSGDWINVSRDLLRLDIESASGGRLEGSLVYTERYL